jgi:transposase-like protein
MLYEKQFCPNPACPDYGRLNLGNIVCYGRYGKNKIKLLRCRICRHRFSERHHTVFFGLHTDERTVEKIFRSLAKGNGIRATARIIGVDKMTVQRIFNRAAAHCEKVLNQLMKDLRIEEFQLDELRSFIKKTKTSPCARKFSK